MKREKRSDKIYKVISRHTQDLELSHLDAGLVFLQIQHLAQETGITPNNVSLEAKLLYEGGRLIRIGNRPVAYASLDHIEKLLGHTVETRVFPLTALSGTACQGRSLTPRARAFIWQSPFPPPPLSISSDATKAFPFPSSRPKPPCSIRPTACIPF